MSITILEGDCRERLRELEAGSIDSCVCDPPYELGFMGKGWDRTGIANDVEMWREVLRVLKPGAYLVAFAATRTYHRMTCAIEDAGFEIRDQIGWAFGSGFPKSLDVSKAIDKQRDDRADILRVTSFVADAADRQGKTRTNIDAHMGTSDMAGWWTSRLLHRCQCPKWDQWLRLKLFLGLTDEMDAEVWRLNGRKGTPGEAWDQREVIGRATDGAANGSVVGLGSPSSMAQEYDLTAPTTEAAKQWQGWGTALKPAWEPICLARKPLVGTVAANVLQHGTGALNIDGCRIEAKEADDYGRSAANAKGTINAHNGFEGKSFKIAERDGEYASPLGRWPANIIHDGSEDVLAGFPETSSGALTRSETARAEVGKNGIYGSFKGAPDGAHFPASEGSAARFFYTAKSSAAERGSYNNHPTVKPVDLMRWLCRLVTPKGGTVLDPFMGSGSTMIAADAEQFNGIGCELSPEYAAIAERRIRDAGGMFAEVLAA